jgi:hypothetical protein
VKQDAGGRLQEIRSRMQEIRGRKQAAAGKEFSAAFVRAFTAGTRPVTGEGAEDEAWVAQMMGWLTVPRAGSSAEVIRRVIERVEYRA